MIINGKWMSEPEIIALISQVTADKKRLERQVEQSANQCKMILELDCRGCPDTFLCTNCQPHIRLGFIGQSYGGNYCIECGAEVEDGETE